MSPADKSVLRLDSYTELSGYPVKTTKKKAELAAGYALGDLDAEETLAVQSLADDAEFQAEALEFREMLSDFALLAPAAPPPASVQKRVMANITARPDSPLPKGLAALVATGSLEWKATPFAGVSAKKLFQDADGNISWMVKLEAGAVYPRHKHSTYEHCLVLEGEVEFDEYVLRAGDYEVANPDSDHSAFRSPAGAVLFIIANKHDEVF